jgi:hypothetical protein
VYCKKDCKPVIKFRLFSSLEKSRTIITKFHRFYCKKILADILKPIDFEPVSINYVTSIELKEIYESLKIP